MNIKTFINIKCKENGITVESLAIEKLGYKTRQAMYHHVNKGNKEVLEKIESILELPSGELTRLIKQT